MTTAELAQRVGCHPKTIKAMVARRDLDATPVGGRTGYIFDDATAIDAARNILKMRHADRIEARRKARAKARRSTI